MAWMVILEGPDGASGDPRRDVFEVTPPPAPGREREELGRLVRGIHPGAAEVAWDGERAVFDDGGRSVTARFARSGGDDPGPPSQGTLFDGSARPPTCRNTRSDRSTYAAQSWQAALPNRDTAAAGATGGRSTVRPMTTSEELTSTATVVVESRHLDTDERVRDVHHVRTPSNPDEERAHLLTLVRGLHPDAAPRSYADGAATFLERDHLIVAFYESRAIAGHPGHGGLERPRRPPVQDSLFDL